MPKYAVNLEGLNELIGRLGDFSEQIEQWLEDLDQRIARLQSSWDGEAAAAQQQAHDEWIAGARQMNEALVDLRASAETAHTNYTSALAANQKMWS